METAAAAFCMGCPDKNRPYIGYSLHLTAAGNPYGLLLQAHIICHIVF
jgi:hypothetical protein